MLHRHRVQPRPARRHHADPLHAGATSTGRTTRTRSTRSSCRSSSARSCTRRRRTLAVHRARFPARVLDRPVLRAVPQPVPRARDHPVPHELPHPHVRVAVHPPDERAPELGARHARPRRPPPVPQHAFAVILGLTYGFLPFMILPLYASIERMDESLVEASYDLGHGKVVDVLPRDRAVGVARSRRRVLLVFIPAVGDFVTPQLLGGVKTHDVRQYDRRPVRAAATTGRWARRCRCC